MNLTTLAKVSAYLDAGYAEKTALLNDIIASVSEKVRVYLDRTVTTAATVETFTIEPGARFVKLKAWPVSSIAYVANDTSRTFSSSTYIDSDDYYLDIDAGTIEFDFALTPGRGALRVSYTGGMAATDAAFVAVYPDIAGAVTMQVVHEFRSRDALAAMSFAAAGVSASTNESVGLLAEVKRVLDLHRRVSLA